MSRKEEVPRQFEPIEQCDNIQASVLKHQITIEEHCGNSHSPLFHSYGSHMPFIECKLYCIASLSLLLSRENNKIMGIDFRGSKSSLAFAAY